MNEDELRMVLESVVSNYEGATIEYYSTFHRSGRQTKKIVIEYDVKSNTNE